MSDDSGELEEEARPSGPAIYADRSDWSLARKWRVYWADIVMFGYVVMISLVRPEMNFYLGLAKWGIVYLWLFNLLMHKASNIRRSGKGFFK